MGKRVRPSTSYTEVVRGVNGSAARSRRAWGERPRLGTSRLRALPRGDGDAATGDQGNHLMGEMVALGEPLVGRVPATNPQAAGGVDSWPAEAVSGRRPGGRRRVRPCVTSPEACSSERGLDLAVHVRKMGSCYFHRIVTIASAGATLLCFDLPGELDCGHQASAISDANESSRAASLLGRTM